MADNDKPATDQHATKDLSQEDLDQVQGGFPNLTQAMDDLAKVSKNMHDTATSVIKKIR